MKNLFLFNPENDMALAYGGPYYMPPANVRKMANDLSALPLWYASTGDDVWMAEKRQVEWMDRLCPLPIEANRVENLKPVYNKVYPWGWSAAVVHRLRQAGLRDDMCPSDMQIERIRQLSARGTALKVLHEMSEPHLFRGAASVTAVAQVEAFVQKYGRIMVKAPWSGSGRGVRPLEGMIDTSLQGWISHIIKTQGSVVVEPYYNKVVDFAMEFLAEVGEVKFAGYSLFETDLRGIYKENVLATDERIESELAAYVSVDELKRISVSLERILTEVVGDAYEGCLGVDMMVCRVEGIGYAVHPCVEINLRMNMGYTSHVVASRYIHPSSLGRFVVEYYPTGGDALRMHHALQERHPLVVDDGRMKCGYLSLTPVFRDTSYQIYLLVEG